MISHGFGIFSSLGLPKMVMFTYRKKLLIQPTKKDDKRIENSVYRFGKQLWTYQVMIAIFMRKSQKTNVIACVHRDSCCTEKIWLSYDFFFSHWTYSNRKTFCWHMSTFVSIEERRKNYLPRMAHIELRKRLRFVFVSIREHKLTSYHTTSSQFQPEFG